MARSVGATLAACLLAAVVGCSQGNGATDAPPPNAEGPVVEVPSGPEEVCRVADPRLPEISGLAASTQHPGILWTHNDSGDRAQLFALDALTCEVKAVVRLRGVDAWDTEAIAVGRDANNKPVLWFGDIGDNTATAASVRLYRLPEPAQIKDQTVNLAATITVKYADEPYNAEALLVEPSPEGRIWIVTRRQSAQGAYYELPSSAWGSSTTVTVRAVGSVPALTTDATFAPNGETYALRTYFGATQFNGTPPGGNSRSIDVGFTGQSEALTYSYDSRLLYTISEGMNQPLIKVPLP